MKRIFLNGSKNYEGKTAQLAYNIYKQLPFNSINLVDYHINQIGQEYMGDDFFNVLREVAQAEVLVIGTPIYWSNMSGHLKTFIDRLTELILDKQDILRKIKVYLVITDNTTQETVLSIERSIRHVTQQFQMDYKGLIQTNEEAKKVNQQLLRMNNEA